MGEVDNLGSVCVLVFQSAGLLTISPWLLPRFPDPLDCRPICGLPWYERRDSKVPGENHRLAVTGTETRRVMLEAALYAGLAALVASTFACLLIGDQGSGLSMPWWLMRIIDTWWPRAGRSTDYCDNTTVLERAGTNITEMTVKATQQRVADIV